MARSGRPTGQSRCAQQQNPTGVVSQPHDTGARPRSSGGPLLGLSSAVPSTATRENVDEHAGEFRIRFRERALRSVALELLCCLVRYPVSVNIREDDSKDAMKLSFDAVCYNVLHDIVRAIMAKGREASPVPLVTGRPSVR